MDLSAVKARKQDIEENIRQEERRIDELEENYT
jgi:hypothetical protein